MRGDTWGSVYMDSNFSSALYNRHAPPFNWPIHLCNPLYEKGGICRNIHFIAFGGFLYSRIYRAIIPSFVLMVLPGQIWYAWEKYHWIGLKKSSIAISFWFFNFGHEFLKKLQSSEPLHSKMDPAHAHLDHGLYGHTPQSLPPNRAPKMPES